MPDAGGRRDADAPAAALGDRASRSRTTSTSSPAPRARASSTAPSTCTSSSSTAAAPTCSASDVREALRCIRCGACMNHCPVYQNIGGHSYGWVYPGPIGSILTPMYVGLENALDLPQASTLCNQCGVVCPVKIPLPDLQRKLREREFERRPAAVERARWHSGSGLVRAAARALRAACPARRPAAARAWRGARRHDPQAAARRRLDRRARHAGARRPHVPRAVRQRQQGGRRDERSPRTTHLTLPRLSRRAESLGTENAFVVLAEVNALIRARQGHRFVLHRPARLPDAGQRAGRGDRGDPRRQARLHAERRHRRAARRGGARPGLAARPRHRARRRRGRRRRQAVHRLHDRLGDRLRRRRRGDLPGARVSRSTNRRSTPTARCRCRSTCASRADSRSTRPSSKRRSRRRRAC